MNNSSAEILMDEKATLPKYILKNDEMKFIGIFEVSEIKDRV